MWFYSHLRVVCCFSPKQGLLGDISVSHLKVKDEAGIELMNVIFVISPISLYLFTFSQNIKISFSSFQNMIVINIHRFDQFLSESKLELVE